MVMDLPVTRWRHPATTKIPLSICRAVLNSNVGNFGEAVRVVAGVITPKSGCVSYASRPALDDEGTAQAIIKGHRCDLRSRPARCVAEGLSSYLRNALSADPFVRRGWKTLSRGGGTIPEVLTSHQGVSFGPFAQLEAKDVESQPHRDRMHRPDVPLIGGLRAAREGISQRTSRTRVGRFDRSNRLGWLSRFGNRWVCRKRGRQQPCTRRRRWLDRKRRQGW
jgi:hypothetical protein